MVWIFGFLSSIQRDLRFRTNGGREKVLDMELDM